MIPNELRIGNWALYPHSIHEPFQITEPRHIELAYLLKPIPLTPELLEAIEDFGPTEIQGENSYFNGDNILIRVQDMTLFLHSELDGSVFRVRQLKYLHELQNLYFLIEGKELTIALPTLHKRDIIPFMTHK
jgi:hypothetical protein